MIVQKLKSLFCLIVLCAGVKSFASNSSILPKCCANDEILIKSIGLECKRAINKAPYHIVNNETNEYFKICKRSDDYCMDQFEDKIVKVICKNKTIVENNLKLDPDYAKCCPLNYSYDSKEHKCNLEQIPNPLFNFTQSTLLVKIGVQNCNFVLKDYFFNKLSELQINGGNLLLNGESYPPSNYCLEKEFNKNKYVLRVCHKNYDVCKSSVNDGKIKCVRKCCPDGQTFYNATKCLTTFDSGLSLANISKVENFNDDFAIIHGTKCVSKGLDQNYTYHLDSVGNLHWTIKGEEHVYTPEDGQYCIERIGADTNNYAIFFCQSPQQKSSTTFLVNQILSILSCICLCLTIVAFIILRENMNLYKRTLITYCSCLLAAFICLLIVQFNSKIGQPFCTIFAFLIQFTFLTAFTWLNIMCFDIWWTFGSMRVPGVNQKKKERKRYIYYSIYAWLIPILWTTMTIIIHEKKALPSNIAPQIGNHKCFLEKGNGFLIFHVLPIGLLLLCNTILFVRTIYYCIKVKNEINQMLDNTEKKKSFLADKERLSMLLKFFVIMGVSFIFEAISASVDATRNNFIYAILYAFDVINSLQGVFIFIISIAQRKTIASLKRKIGLEKERRKSTTQSSLTTSTTLLSRISTDRKKSTA